MSKQCGLDYAGSEYGPVADRREHIDEYFVSMKSKEFI
jgi:hypothetical protein